jgi:hypothetical protein
MLAFSFFTGSFLAAAALVAWLACRRLANFNPGQSQPPAAANVTPVGFSSGNVAAAAANAALPAVAGKTTYIEGFDITGLGATAASEIAVTVTGLQTQTGTLTFNINIPAGVTAQVNASSPNGGYSFRFPTPLPASAVNTVITVNVPSFGSGNTNACTTAYGFQA